jgi:hypothetical protein
VSLLKISKISATAVGRGAGANATAIPSALDVRPERERVGLVAAGLNTAFECRPHCCARSACSTPRTHHSSSAIDTPTVDMSDTDTVVLAVRKSVGLAVPGILYSRLSGSTRRMLGARLSRATVMCTVRAQSFSADSASDWRCARGINTGLPDYTQSGPNHTGPLYRGYPLSDWYIY